MQCPRQLLNTEEWMKMNLEIVAQKEILPRKANQRSYSLTVIRLLYLTYHLQICSFTSYWQDYLIVLLFFFLLVLEIKLRVPHTLSKCSTIEPHPQPQEVVSSLLSLHYLSDIIYWII